MTNSEETATEELLEKLKEKFKETENFPYSIYLHNYLKYYNYCNNYKNQPLVIKSKEDYYFQTDLIICDNLEKNKNLKDEDIEEFGTPRIVIEIKNKKTNSHDIITYAAKAEKHKILCPHLQYGYIIIDSTQNIPPRLINHGLNYDFAYMYNSNSDIDDLFINIIVPAIINSINIEKLLSNIEKNNCKNEEQWFRRDFNISSCLK